LPVVFGSTVLIDREQVKIRVEDIDTLERGSPTATGPSRN
jgi:endonuclease YncB( thermonuclease family)